MRLAIWQADHQDQTPDARLAGLEAAIRGQGIDLVLCPELFATGYFLAQPHRTVAEPADGPFAKAVQALAVRTGTTIAYGWPEAGADRPYNAAQVVTPSGPVLSHRKRIDAPHCFEGAVFANGAASVVARISGFKVAILICYEVEFPELVRDLAQQGIDLLLVPTALIDIYPTVPEILVPARAIENGIWVAYGNWAGQGGGKRFLGQSRIVAPDGRIVAVAGAGPALIQADIDLESLQRERDFAPYLADLARIGGRD